MWRRRHEEFLEELGAGACAAWREKTGNQGRNIGIRKDTNLFGSGEIERLRLQDAFVDFQRFGGMVYFSKICDVHSNTSAHPLEDLLVEGPSTTTRCRICSI
jgi:hypothetical protein